MPTQLPRVPSLIPSSFATRAIGRDVSITIFTASSLNSGEKLFFGRGNSFTFPDFHPNGWTVRKPRGASVSRSVRERGLVGGGFFGEGFLGEVTQDSFIEGGEGVEFGGGKQVD